YQLELEPLPRADLEPAGRQIPGAVGYGDHRGPAHLLGVFPLQANVSRVGSGRAVVEPVGSVERLSVDTGEKATTTGPHEEALGVQLALSVGRCVAVMGDDDLLAVGRGQDRRLVGPL